MSAVMSNSHYSRRVSFNTLNPDFIACDSTAVGMSKAKMDYEDYGYGERTLFGDIGELFKSNPVFTPRRKSKTHEEQLKSILKNKDVDSRVVDSTINYHETNGMNVDSDSDSDDGATLQPQQLDKRRKSYTEMTDEELMALDPQFQLTKSKTSNMDQFKFDSQKMYYLPSNRRSSVLMNNNARSAYPSSNENNYKSISLTVRHVEYDKVETNRTILTVISGRKHTWNSIDWFLMTNQITDVNRLLVDGDHLIVGCLIPLKFLKQNDQKKKCGEEIVYKKCEHLLEYIYSSLPSDLKVKITVEFVTDNEADSDPSKKEISGAKFMLSHLTKQYQPMLIVIGIKSTNLNFKYPKKIKNNQNQNDEYLIKLSSYVVKYSTVPVILVGNNTIYHFDESKKKHQANITISFTPPTVRKDSSSSIESCETYTGESESVSTKLESLWNSGSEDKFKNMMLTVSDNSYNESMTYIRAINSKAENTKINSKIHLMYKSQTNSSSNGRSVNNSDRMYKVRSMVSYDEDEEIKNEKIRKVKKKSNLKSSNSDSQIAPIEPKKKSKKSIWKKLNIFK